MTDFGWHYPPGVTGNEPEIAGRSEDECEACNGHGWTAQRDLTGGAPDGIWKTDCEECDGTGEVEGEVEEEFDNMAEADAEYDA